MKRFFGWLFSFLFLIAPAKGELFDPKINWKTLQTQHFNIHFPEKAESVAVKLGQIAERVYENLTPQIRWKPWGRTEVVITDHTDVTNGFATVLPYNQIVLYLTPPRGTATLSNYDDWLTDLFTHEFTHILHIDKYGGIAKPFHWIFGKLVAPNGLTPGWVREGLAVYYESQKGRGRVYHSYTEMMLRTDILQNQFLSIDEAAGVQIHWPASQAAYLYGGAFWQYLSDTYGPEKIPEFIQRYGDSVWIFSLNNKARKTFNNKNFLKLWKEWKEHLTHKYQPIQTQLEKEGFTNLEEVIPSQQSALIAPTLSHNERWLVYAKADPDEGLQIWLRDLHTQKDQVLEKKKISDQFSFSPDDQKILYSSLGTYKRYNQYTDLYEYDLKTKTSRQVTQGRRALDGDYSPDGKQIVFVAHELVSTQLFLKDLKSEKERQLTQAPSEMQFSNPRFSPDGQSIVVSAFNKGQRDLYLYDLQGKEKKITSDLALDNEPRFSPDGKWLYYTSDKTGISNIYRLQTTCLAHIRTNKNPRQNTSASKTNCSAELVSNVLTGLFAPQPLAHNQVLAQHYFGRGFNIVRFSPHAYSLAALTVKQEKAKSDDLPDPHSLHPLLTERREVSEQTSHAPTSYPETAPYSYKVKKYQPLSSKLFLPRYVTPGFVYADGVALFSANIGSADPLNHHFWSAGLNYRNDANFLGGYFNYTYNRYRVPISVGYSDSVSNYGDLFGVGKNFFEQRRRAYISASTAHEKHRFGLSYVFEHRSDQSNFNLSDDSQLNLGRFGGFAFYYSYNNVTKKPAGISLEKGPRFYLSFEINDSALGSSANNETKIVEADLRYYLNLPWAKHHVLALRVGGGINFGDKLYQGVFRLGSATGEGLLSGASAHLFPLRGLPQITFAGDRALLMSAEYRLPLYSVERGVATAPIFLNQLHLGVFSDFGGVFNGTPQWNEFFWGVGFELRGDFVIGYGLPVTGRLGYGILVKGRQWIGGLKDPILGNSLKYGTLILQIGTSF